jgi:phosphoglycolate phosphatase
MELLIFDLDGTLVDSSIDLQRAINYALEPLLAEPVSLEETKRLVGEGITRLVEKLIEERPGLITREELLERFINYYSEHLLDHTTPYPQVETTLERLQGYKKAVVSNKNESMSRAIINGFGMGRFFDMIVGADTIGHKKPSPLPLLYVMDTLNVDKEKTLLVGDSNYDIEAGKAAGIYTVAVTYGFRPAESLKDADSLIDSFEQLLDVLPRKWP